MRLFIACVVALVCLIDTSAALACGTSADGVSSCDLAEHEEATRPKWHVGASGGLTSTALHFSGGARGDETRASALATVAYAPTPQLTFHAGAGAALGGHLSMPDGVHEFSAGPAAAIGASWRVIAGRPFVVLSSLLSFTAATTQRSGESSVGYEAFDLRLGAIFGTTIADIWSPYALARVFGGPVLWRYGGQAVTGTDAYHYQLGAGFSLALANRWSLFAEGAALGERALDGGVSFGF